MRAGRGGDDRAGDQGHRRGRAVPDPRALRRSYACRERDADGQPVRARGGAAWHDHDVHRSARGGERAGARRGAADARRGGGAADQRLRRDAGLRALGAGAGDHRRRARAGGRGRGDGLAADRRARRDDELSRRDRCRPEDARRDRGDPGGGEDGGRALRQPGPRPTSRPMPRAGRRTITRAPGRRTRSCASARGCGRCCGSGAPGTT